MRRMRWLAVLATLLCGSTVSPTVEGNPTPVAPARPGAKTDLERQLATDLVDRHKFSRATFYTWTTEPQIAELRARKQLLTREESPSTGAPFIDQVLFALVARGDPMAKLLYTAPFAKKRFAWVSPWATRAGWENEQYGNQPIRITLRPDAWIVHVSVAGGVVEVHDLRDQVVPMATALANPQRIAAIYFVSLYFADALVPPAPGMPRAVRNYREYVLCNESMIASWEVGTARVAAELEEAAKKVEAIGRWVTASKFQPINDPLEPLLTAWEAPAAGPRAAYGAALAFVNDNYGLAAPNFERIATQLRQTPKLPAIEVLPKVAFVRGATRKAPRIVNGGNDTYAKSISPTAAHLTKPPMP